MKLIWRTLRDLLPYLPGRAQRFLLIYSVATCVLAIFDIAALGLLAVAISGIIANIAITLPIVGRIGMDGYPILMVVLSGIVIVKSLVNIVLQWVSTRRFAIYELEIGDQLFAAYIRAPWVDRLKRTTAELVRLADVGIANTISGFLLPVASLPAMLVTFVALLVVLVIAQPLTAVITLVYLGLIGVLLYFWVAKKSVEAGKVNRDFSMRVAALMTEMVSALKEITLRDRVKSVGDVVHSTRIHTTRARANMAFLGAVPRFVIDSALVGGFLIIGAVTFLSSGMAAAIGAVALFGVAGFRMVPSLTGFQSVVAQTSSSAPHVQAVLADIDMSREYISHAENIGHEPLTGNPRELVLASVEFTYPGSEFPAVQNVDLRVPMGSTVALVGSSGAGKSTLVDILLGLLVPSKGIIEIDGQPLEDVLGAWRSRVGYVPQEVALFDGSVAQNVALTWDDDFDRSKVRQALRRAQLLDVIESRPGGLEARIGERGLTLSGGQRQRLGIARALYVDPLVLVLDEATSALDTKTESDVAAALNELKGEVTVISVAHRLSTIRHSDQVCFMKGGTVLARGSFEELVRTVPDFSVQAALAGLA